MSALRSEEPMLPDTPEAVAETPWQVGFRHGETGHHYADRPIPPAHRRAYARGFARGRVAAAKKDSA